MDEGGKKRGREGKRMSSDSRADTFRFLVGFVGVMKPIPAKYDVDDVDTLESALWSPEWSVFPLYLFFLSSDAITRDKSMLTPSLLGSGRFPPSPPSSPLPLFLCISLRQVRLRYLLRHKHHSHVLCLCRFPPLPSTFRVSFGHKHLQHCRLVVE